jgi:hypothetical protein
MTYQFLSTGLFGEQHGAVKDLSHGQLLLLNFGRGYQENLWLPQNCPANMNDHRLAGFDSNIRELVSQLLLHGYWIKPGNIAKSILEPGEYYPRIWRGIYDEGDRNRSTPVYPQEFYGSTFTYAINSMLVLFEELESIFKFVEPSKENGGAYGHKIRQLLILACTEVEACLKGAFRVNFDCGTRLNMNDYVRLLKPMGLNHYTVRLRAYPRCPSLKPFKHWHRAKPTTTLFWYQDYHAVKHDREAEFNKSTLTNVLNALAALYILHCAQWGPQVFSKSDHGVQSPFTLRTIPAWGIGELSVPPLGDGKEGRWRPVRYCDRNPEVT